ncbi:DNA repair protein RecO [Candidatus Falkowbacteria bacterium RBG_13_39_14]|uniref:DNA repair protein RecO n=1 Tax=Candidatus Falkowbacteria bacterium RBG_13_39_14 TaxID=1797985 RepID=A0A1F5S4V8_9BACT|nr:MAG: DNA repair protein RecO [Candidatus Falkowbacteria bacterium RBG_13_39_14]
MYTTQGFVLRKYNIEEADRMYIIYTKDYGKKNLFCKGALKIKSKLSPHLAEFADADFDFVKGKSVEKIVGARMEKSFVNIRGDLRKIAIGNFILDAIDNLIKPDHPDREIYILIKKALEIIDGHKDIRKAYFSANIFIWKLLILLGYKPEFDKCAKCGMKLKEPYFDERTGEFFCGECFRRRAGAGSRDGLYREKIPPNPPLQRGGERTPLCRSSLEYLKGNPMAEVNFDEIIFIVKSFMRLHLEKVLKSEVWITKLFDY